MGICTPYYCAESRRNLTAKSVHRKARLLTCHTDTGPGYIWSTAGRRAGGANSSVARVTGFAFRFAFQMDQDPGAVAP